MVKLAPTPPSANAYAKALRRIEPHIKESWRAMLKAHVAAPKYTMSASKLAKAAGFKSFHGANLQYGLFGALLASEVGYRPSQASSSFASFSRKGNDDWQWHLHKPFAQALRVVGWVKSDAG